MSRRSPLAAMVILICIIGYLFVGAPLVNAQAEDALSEESLERLDNIEKLLVEIGDMLDEIGDMLDDISRNMVTRDEFINRTSAISDTISSISDEMLSMEEMEDKFTALQSKIDYISVTSILEMILILAIALFVLVLRRLGTGGGTH